MHRAKAAVAVASAGHRTIVQRPLYISISYCTLPMGNLG